MDARTGRSCRPQSLVNTVHICIGGPTHEIEVDGRTIRFEFHRYLGPTFLNKQEEPIKFPTKENAPEWRGFRKWFGVYHALGKAWGMVCHPACVFCERSA